MKLFFSREFPRRRFRNFLLKPLQTVPGVVLYLVVALSLTMDSPSTPPKMLDAALLDVGHGPEFDEDLVNGMDEDLADDAEDEEVFASKYFSPSLTTRAPPPAQCHHTHVSPVFSSAAPERPSHSLQC